MKTGINKKCIICGEKFYVRPSRKHYKACSTKCAGKIISQLKKGKPRSEETKAKISKTRKGKYCGENNPSWKGGRIQSNNGYVYIYEPQHPFAKKGKKKYVPEHRLIAEKYLGRYLKKNEIIHHINGKKNDNRIKNLYLFSSKKDHDRFHTTNRNYAKKNKHKIQIIIKSNLI